MSRVLLVGAAPGPAFARPYRPLHPVPATGSGGRLAQVMGVSPETYLRLFDRTNLLTEPAGRWANREDRFPIAVARNAARAMEPLLRDRRVVMLGRDVARAFGVDPALPFHEWRGVYLEHAGVVATIAVAPHPSGRCRWYNDPANLRAARLFWRPVVEEVPQ